MRVSLRCLEGLGLGGVQELSITQHMYERFCYGFGKVSEGCLEGIWDLIFVCKTPLRTSRPTPLQLVKVIFTLYLIIFSYESESDTT